MRSLALSATALVAAAVLAGCSAQLADRGGQEGATPDKIGDVGYIAVYRSADNFPNIAQVCVEGLGFATTSSGRGESGGATPLIRVEAWDSFCASRLVGTP